MYTHTHIPGTHKGKVPCMPWRNVASASSLIFCPFCPSCFPVGIPILLFFLLGKPFERGLYCDDESLRYPYKDSTVSSLLLYFVGMFLPAISVSLLLLGTSVCHAAHLHSSPTPPSFLSFLCPASSFTSYCSAIFVVCSGQV